MGAEVKLQLVNRMDRSFKELVGGDGQLSLEAELRSRRLVLFQ